MKTKSSMIITILAVIVSCHAADLDRWQKLKSVGDRILNPVVDLLPAPPYTTCCGIESNKTVSPIRDDKWAASISNRSMVRLNSADFYFKRNIAVSNLIQGVSSLTNSTIGPSELRARFPHVNLSEAWIPKHPAFLKQSNIPVYFGVTIILAKLDAIKRVERDYMLLHRIFRKDYDYVTPVPGSYKTGRSANGPFNLIQIEQRVRGQLGCPAFAFTQSVLEHFDGKYLVTDGTSSSSSVKRFFFRDTYIPIADQRGVLGYVVISALSLDFGPCLDDEISELRKNLSFMCREAGSLQSRQP